MTKNLFIQASIVRLMVALMTTLMLSGVMTNAQATPAYMAAYGAPSCLSCHTTGVYSNRTGQAGLAKYLAAATPTCTPPQVLRNNVCVTPTPTCVAPQVLQNNVCVTPTPTCVAPQVLQNNVCVTPTPTCIAPQVLQNNVCITPIPTCVAPQVLQNNVCVTPTPTCVAPQVLQDNVCVTPIPTCVAPQVLQDNVCVTPVPTCVAPQVLQNNICITPTPTCVAPQVLQNNVCVTQSSTTTVVRMQTSLGLIDIRLFDSAAPSTVANFLKYIDSGAYTRSFIHRSIPGALIEGGGYVWNDASNQASAIVANSPIMNEFSASRSNLRGMVAMDKRDGDPNSATSQWFINLTDNSAKFDSQNGGYTVFGQVFDRSMSVIDSIAGLPRGNSGGAFTDLPLASPVTGSTLQKANLVVISAVSTNRANTGASDSDRLFAYLEAAYPEYLAPGYALSPANSGSASAAGYYYRYYPDSKAYIATNNGTLYYLGPLSQNQVMPLGSLADWFTKAKAAGY